MSHSSYFLLLKCFSQVLGTVASSFKCIPRRISEFGSYGNFALLFLRNAQVFYIVIECLRCKNRIPLRLELSLLNITDQPQPREECLLRQPFSQDSLSCLKQAVPERRKTIHTQLLQMNQFPCFKPLHTFLFCFCEREAPALSVCQ